MKAKFILSLNRPTGLLTATADKHKEFKNLYTDINDIMLGKQPIVMIYDFCCKIESVWQVVGSWGVAQIKFEKDV